MTRLPQRVDVAPYNKDLTGVRTRLGLKPGTTAPQLLRALRRFALDDSAYALLNTYTVEPYVRVCQGAAGATC